LTIACRAQQEADEPFGIAFHPGRPEPHAEKAAGGHYGRLQGAFFI
jgi:hypothetical protein